MTARRLTYLLALLLGMLAAATGVHAQVYEAPVPPTGWPLPKSKVDSLLTPAAPKVIRWCSDSDIVYISDVPDPCIPMMPYTNAPLRRLFALDTQEIPRDEAGRLIRNPTVLAHFQRLNPCPVTGLKTGACPGWVKDHIIPLCAGGHDAVENLQWQTVAESKKKDKAEITLCAWIERAHTHKVQTV